MHRQTSHLTLAFGYCKAFQRLENTADGKQNGKTKASFFVLD